MKNLSRCFLSIAVITAMLIFTSCSSGKAENEEKLTVAVSVVPQETFVRNIAGDLVDIVTVIPPEKARPTMPLRLRSWKSSVMLQYISL